MIYLIAYLIIGLIFTIYVDSIARRHLKPENQFTNFDRLQVSTLWPINVAIFIIQFIKELRK